MMTQHMPVKMIQRIAVADWTGHGSQLRKEGRC